MTVLSVVQDVSRQLRLAVPTVLFAGTDQFSKTMQALVNESATAIAKAHDWRKFTTLKTQAGDGSTTSFSLPNDYDRMPVKAQIFLTSTTRPMAKIDDLDVWQENRLQSISNPGGEWMILSGSLQIYPAMSASDSAKYYYQTNLIVTSASDATTFTVDTDTFKLPERLLKLDLIWRFLAGIGMDYTEDMRNSEIALSQEIARDKGSRIIKVGMARMPSDVELAYPGTIDA